MKKIVLSLVALCLVATACNKAQNVTMTVGHVPSSVEGNVVTIPVNIKGIKIVKADGDTSGKSGHFHVFIDRNPVKVGKTIPKMRGIVHSSDNPIKIYGLTPGRHVFRIVLGNGEHKRILGKIRHHVRVNVKGPGVQGTVAPTAKKGEDVTVQLASEGVKIVDPGSESSANEAHYHVIVDPTTPPKAGSMDRDEAYMTAASSVTLKGLSAGEHVIWVVLEDKDHKALDPPVMDKLTVTVS